MVGRGDLGPASGNRAVGRLDHGDEEHAVGRVLFAGRFALSAIARAEVPARFVLAFGGEFRRRNHEQAIDGDIAGGTRALSVVA